MTSQLALRMVGSLGRIDQQLDAHARKARGVLSLDHQPARTRCDRGARVRRVDLQHPAVVGREREGARAEHDVGARRMNCVALGAAGEAALDGQARRQGARAELNDLVRIEARGRFPLPSPGPLARRLGGCLKVRSRACPAVPLTRSSA